MGLTDQLRPGESAVGNWISIGHPAVGELCARGFDFVVVDTEHTDMSLETVGNVLRGIDGLEENVPALVRVPWNDPVRIKRVLDQGADGVVVPMVETAVEAERAVEATRYPPEGIRGVAPARASNYGRGFGDYFERANDDVVTVVQIESVEGVDNAAEIVSVDGVDAVLVGPGDLSASLGVFGRWESDRFREALATVIDATHEVGCPIGLFATGPDDIHRWVNAGADFVIAGTDTFYIEVGSDDARTTFEAAVDDATE